MWNENPKGIGHKWGLRPKKDRPKGWNHRGSSRGGRPGTSQSGFDWRATKDSKDEVEMAKKEHEKRMRAAFDSMDINNDGDLSKEEVRSCEELSNELKSHDCFILTPRRFAPPLASSCRRSKPPFALIRKSGSF